MLKGVVEGTYAVTLFLLGFFLSGMAAVNGSRKSIKREWHREDIYSACIRPNVPQVLYPGSMAGFFTLMGLILLTRLTHLVTREVWWQIPADIGCMATASLVAFLCSRTLGRIVYSRKIREGGY